jgi:hypothetical protein
VNGVSKQVVNLALCVKFEFLHSLLSRVHVMVWLCGTRVKSIVTGCINLIPSSGAFSTRI